MNQELEDEQLVRSRLALFGEGQRRFVLACDLLEYVEQLASHRLWMNSMANICHQLDDVNNMDHPSFISHFGSIYEHSPWVADRAWSRRPFRSVEELHAAMDEVMFRAPIDDQMNLVRAHPQLAGRLARLGQLTETSRSEQSQAGLDRLATNQIATMNQLNTEYLDKFGFPFIICARLNDAESIIAALKARLGQDPQSEFTTALHEISKIARLRLADIVI
jgi:2-oxo-4-hydroxy-4-carboxy-5-ureidoimidazoline decarboxylase